MHFSPRVLHDYNRDNKIIDGPIELIIVTHADSDHWRGLRRILGFDTIGTHPHSMLEFWEPGYDRDCDAGSSATGNYLDFIERVQQIDAAIFRRPLEEFIEPAIDSGDLEFVPLPNIPEVKLTLLHSEKDPPGGDCSYQINNASIVFMAEIDTFRFLFAGDANGKERDELGPGTPGHVEAMLLNLEESHPGMLRAHLLKAPHHGSETASTQAFIDAVNPEIVVFSASTVHGLPRTTVVERYHPNERKILRTDRNPGNDNDHILCEVDSGALMCEYEDEL